MIAQQIHFLSNLTEIRCSEFRHLILSANHEDANVATAQVVFRYNVPANQTWIVTEIDLRQLNPSPVPASDFRSDDIDYNGLTNAWINVNGNPLIASNGVVSFALFNRPVLLVFKGGDKVTIVIQRNASSLPASAYQIHIAANGYLAPALAASKLGAVQSTIQQPPSP